MYGIFHDSDDSLVVRGYPTWDAAANIIRDKFPSDHTMHVAEICPDHNEQQKATCKLCALSVYQLDVLKSGSYGISASWPGGDEDLRRFKRNQS